MKTVYLNSKENEVYNICKDSAKRDGDNGYEFIIEKYMLSSSNLTINQFKGYLSQLVQKGLIEKFEDCYFDFGVIELIPASDRYKECNYNFNIIINN